MSDWGWGFSPEEVKDIVQEFVKASGIETPFVEGRPGRDWMEAFLRRHPDIRHRTTEHLSKSRSAAEKPEIIQQWFRLLNEQLDKAGVKDMPQQIFNTDESGFVTDPKPQKVLARKGAKRVNQTIGGSGKEQIRVNCAGSASGKVLPPYVVYKGKNLYIEWTTGGPAGAAYTTSEIGWMEGPQFLDWFEKIFPKNTQDVSDKTRILIFDGLLSHLTVSVVQEARKNNVVLLRLPAHLTHLLQPFDRAVFRPVKQTWQRLLIKYARTHQGPVGKKDFPQMLKSLYDESFSSDTIKAGFRSTGICPFSPEAVQLDEIPLAGLSSAIPPPSTPFPVLPSPGPSSSSLPGLSSSPPRSLSSSPLPGPSSPLTSLLSSPLPRPSSAPCPGSSPSLLPGPSSSPVPRPSSTPLPDPSSASTSSSSPVSSSVKDFFLARLMPHYSQSRGRSARVQRFRYGESLTLTEEESLQRLRDAESKGKGKTGNKGKGKGKGRRRVSRSRSRSPIEAEGDNSTECGRCGQTGGDNWIMCDICDTWFHSGCTNITLSLEDMANEEWWCDFCTN